MQKLLILIALVLIAYMGMRLLGRATRLKTVRADKRNNAEELPATPLKYDEKSGMYVPGDD